MWSVTQHRQVQSLKKPTAQFRKISSWGEFPHVAIVRPMPRSIYIYNDTYIYKYIYIHNYIYIYLHILYIYIHTYYKQHILYIHSIHPANLSFPISAAKLLRSACADTDWPGSPWNDGDALLKRHGDWGSEHWRSNQYVFCLISNKNTIILQNKTTLSKNWTTV